MGIFTNLLLKYSPKHKRKKEILDFLKDPEHYKKIIPIPLGAEKYFISNNYKLPELYFILQDEYDWINNTFELKSSDCYGGSRNMIMSFFITSTFDGQSPKSHFSVFGQDYQFVKQVTFFLMAFYIGSKKVYKVGFRIDEDHSNKCFERSEITAFETLISIDKLPEYFQYFKSIMFDYKDEYSKQEAQKKKLAKISADF